MEKLSSFINKYETAIDSVAKKRTVGGNQELLKKLFIKIDNNKNEQFKVVVQEGRLNR